MGSLWWLLRDTSVLRDKRQTKESSNPEDKGLRAYTLLQGKQMLDCSGRLPRFVRQLLGPEEGSIYLGCERLHW